MTDTPTPAKISELFDEAAVDESIDSPGVDGLVNLLQAGLTAYTITAKEVSAVYQKLDLKVDSSFTSDTFAQFVIELCGGKPLEIVAAAAEVTEAALQRYGPISTWDVSEVTDRTCAQPIFQTGTSTSPYDVSQASMCHVMTVLVRPHG